MMLKLLLFAFVGIVVVQSYSIHKPKLINDDPYVYEKQPALYNDDLNEEEEAQEWSRSPKVNHDLPSYWSGGRQVKNEQRLRSQHHQIINLEEYDNHNAYLNRHSPGY